MTVPDEVINRTFDEQLRHTRPDLMVNLIITMGELVESGLFSDEVSGILREGRMAVQLLVIKAFQEGEIKVFHSDEVSLDDDDEVASDRPYRLPSVDLCQYFSLFNSNYEAVAYMLAAGIIDEKNTDAEFSAWYPTFETEDDAMVFVADFHEMFLWTTLWKSPLFNQESPPPRLKPCMAAIERYELHNSIAPSDKLLKNNEEYKHDPQAFIEVSCQAGEDPKETRTDSEFTVVTDGVAYRWKRHTKEEPWCYVGYRLVRWDDEYWKSKES